MSAPPRLSIVIPTLGRPASLRRVLDGIERTRPAAVDLEVLAVSDAADPDPSATERAIGGRPFPLARPRPQRAGAAAARNAGWRAARAPLVLFLDDDVVPAGGMLAGHLDWHERAPEPETAVLGHVRWAPDLRVTPFMRWLERGIQFDYPAIAGEEAGWGRFYTANVSAKRALLAAVDGLDEEGFPFHYEDLEMARRMHDGPGLRLLYNRDAVGDHLHAVTRDDYRRRVAAIAAAERRFVARYPDVEPYYFRFFSAAAARPPARGRLARLAGVVGPEFPGLGPRVWASFDAVTLQALAGPFLEAWADAEANSSGSPPGGPK